MSLSPDPLNKLLKTWDRPIEPRPTFNEQVWARIEQTNPTADAQPSLGWFGRFTQGHQAIAASLLVLLSAAVGSAAAMAYGSMTKSQHMATAYAQSIDPLQMSGRH